MRFIDKTGKVVIPVQYDEAGSFQKFGKSRSKQ
ncbi:WG repeat-containing protein [Moraxella ovis]